MMKPRHTLLFLTGLFVILAALIVFIPGELFIGDYFLIKIPALTDLFDTTTVRTDTAIAQVYDLSRQMQKETEKDTIESKPAKDSLIVHKDSTRTDTLHVKKKLFDIKNIRIQSLEFPEDNKEVLNSFFRLLATGAADSTLIRILHYGDSQIERDRVTSYLRNMFQTKFGGSGPGLLPAFQPYGKLMSVFHESSSNWKRYTTFGKIDRSLGHHQYGPMAAVSRMIKEDGQEDSIIQASITIRKNKFAYKTLQQFTQCQLLLGNCPDTATIHLYADGLLLETEKCATSFLKKVRFVFPDFTEEIEIRFSSRDDVEVYGMMLDKKTGVAIDNIALRGSAGMEFSHIDPEHLRAAFAFMNPKLLILEFGGNIAPTQAKNYSFYGKRLCREISFLKSLLPSDVAIIVIGIGDMSLKENDKYVSYPNLINIRNEMKKAAFRAGCAYWDLFEAMGGLNSMPQWVKSKPALATSDYVHLTDLGARVMGKMFCAALNQEYENYIKTIR